MSARTFKVSADQARQIHDWMEKTAAAEHAAGRGESLRPLEYVFTCSGIGYGVAARLRHDLEIDVTDYSTW